MAKIIEFPKKKKTEEYPGKEKIGEHLSLLLMHGMLIKEFDIDESKSVYTVDVSMPEKCKTKIIEKRSTELMMLTRDRLIKIVLLMINGTDTEDGKYTIDEILQKLDINIELRHNEVWLERDRINFIKSLNV